jgi:hypothetical protein
MPLPMRRARAALDQASRVIIAFTRRTTGLLFLPEASSVLLSRWRERRCTSRS